MGPHGTTELIIDRAYIERAIELINRAERDILICAYAWRIYENEPERGIQRVLTAIIKARKRGVVVRCIIDKYTSVRPLTEYGIETRFIGQRNTMHTKAICVDKYALLLGSHNLTARATELNRECSIVSYELEPILQFREYFDTIWGHIDASGTTGY